MLASELEAYNAGDFQRGRSRAIEALWCIVQALFLRSFVPGTAQRSAALRLFGARIGKGVVIKPGTRVKFPWKLEVGDHTWIGEDVWIDNLAFVKIGNNCCLSQGAYLCTGSHDWSKPSFDLIVKPIEIHDNAWIAARALVAPGTVVAQGAVVGLGSLAKGRLMEWSIYTGVPAKKVQDRRLTPKMPTRCGGY